MNFTDSNLLLYSYDPDSIFHKDAVVWLEEMLSSGEPFGIPMLSIASFLRISTDRRLKRLGLRMDDAIAAVESWLQVDSVFVVHTAERHLGHLLKCIRSGPVNGAMVTDAQLAALAIEHNATLFTADADFSRFTGLRWRNPLKSRRAVR